MKAVAVIGSGWGDEGKGLFTDFYATPDSLVVRFNGGAQAGHTVVRDGKRHVFHHFGSGSLKGAPTFLSQFFINNPILYFKELDDLRAIGCEPVVFVDPQGIVTTPWDMMINQIVEEHRGGDRHGSCGVGINETIKRHEFLFPLVVRDIMLPPSMIERKLIDIQQHWVSQRLEQLGVTPSEEWRDRLFSSDILHTFVEHCEEFASAVTVTEMGSLLRKQDRDHIVFEGAQGLLLDEDHYFFPHVTHSHTELKNVMELSTESGLSTVDVTYVTRSYATRHGAGPFPREVPGLSYQDETNVHNAWQGTIRFGELDLDLLAESIDNDTRHAKFPISLRLAITCVDQIDATPCFWYQGLKRRHYWQGMASLAASTVGVDSCFISSGPSASDVKRFDFFHSFPRDGLSHLVSGQLVTD